MTLADEAIEFIANEYVIAKDDKHQDIEWQKLAVEGIYSQAIRLHCYAKGLEFALQIAKNKDL